MNKKKSVTISDIAKRVGMTTITVSRALSKPDLVKPATLARILEVARELDYVPNAFARGLKRSESLIIGVITASVDNPFYSEMIKAISREAKKHGYTIMLVTIHDWAVAFAGSLPVVLLVAGQLLTESYDLRCADWQEGALGYPAAFVANTQGKAFPLVGATTLLQTPATTTRSSPCT